jgi:hypothetical protein
MNDDTATRTDQPAAAPAALSIAELPPLEAELHGGRFAGLVTLPDGTHHAVVLLAARPDKRLTWKQAMAWAQSAGGRLPSRPIAALLYANARKTIEPDWYWTDETNGSSDAWYCYFDLGFQYYDYRSAEGAAVAVRLIPLAA